jgi:type II secretory pathway pseudopilin PulG
MDRARQAFTLLEVLIGMAILLTGVVGVIALFPTVTRSNEIAELRSIGATLALMKIEEIRRDNDENDKLINSIKNLSSPTPPIPFPSEPRLSYSFSSTTVLYVNRDSSGNIVDDPLDPRDDPGIARVIVQISPQYRPGKAQILDEYMFDQ